MQETCTAGQVIVRKDLPYICDPGKGWVLMTSGGSGCPPPAPQPQFELYSAYAVVLIVLAAIALARKK